MRGDDAVLVTICAGDEGSDCDCRFEETKKSKLKTSVLVVPCRIGLVDVISEGKVGVTGAETDEETAVV